MPQTGPGVPGPSSAFVPNWDASGKLAVGYSRNPKKFILPRVVKYRKSDQTVGLYLKVNSQEAARVVNTQDFVWPEGSVRPTHEDGLEQFQFLYFRTQRYDYGYNVGYMTRNQANWPLVAYQQGIKASQLMTARTLRFWNVATTSTNWTVAGTGSAGTSSEYDLSSDHTATATALAGGQFDKGTPAAPYLKIAFDKIEALINLDTLATISRPQLCVVINPNQARLWAESPEIHQYIAGSYWAKEELNKGLGPNAKFGLPSSVYGMDVYVDETVVVTSRRGGTLTKVRAFPDQVALVCAKVDEIEGLETFQGKAAPTFDTLTLFWYEDEMTVEEFDDPKNRLTEGHITENTAEVVTSPLSGYLITSTTSVAS